MNDSASKKGQTTRLPDGRSLGYAEYGDPTGRPIRFFPGAPSSRLLHPPEGPATSLGARVIVVERPGFGLSDFQKGRKLLDWPEDVTAFADALGIERFAVAGNSEVDQEMLSHPEIKKMLMENYREAMRAEVRGFAREDISIPVGVWHSEEDANVSSSAARHVAKTIPECRATLLPGEGHWLFLGHWEEVLTSLLS